MVLKSLTTALLITGSAWAFWACSGGTSQSPAQSKAPAKQTKEISGYKVYALNCKLCHGPDGDLGLSGAKDLTASEMTREQRIEIITNGKGAMVAYKAMLSKKEIEAVADYLDTFKKSK